MANSDMNPGQVLQTSILEAREDMEAAPLRAALPISQAQGACARGVDS